MTISKPLFRILIALAVSAPLCVTAANHGSWLACANADPHTAARTNPYAGRQEAIMAGGKLYQRYCSSCHGKDAEGAGKAPALRSPAVADASPGALFWLLRNGSLKRGMPSWSHLPPEQRWQIVSWIQSLARPQNGQ